MDSLSAAEEKSRRWWLWSSLLLSPIVLVVLILQPFYISHLTARYAPLKDRAVLRDIDDMTQRCGLSHVEVFVGGDTYQVAGLGPTVRILTASRYEEELSPEQLSFTLAHELGHQVNGDN